MQKGEHSKGGEAGTAQGGPPGHATAGDGQRAGAGDGAGMTTAGWLDRVALHNRSAAPSAGALRPRLPYPFEAMSFATADAAPQFARPGGLQSQPLDTPPATTHADVAEGRVTPPATDLPRPSVADRATAAPIKPDAPVAAAPAPARSVMEQARGAARIMDAGPLPPPKSAGAAPDTDTHNSPAKATSLATPAAAPAQPVRAMVPATTAAQPAAMPRHTTAATPIKARLPDRGAEPAPPHRTPPRIGVATQPQRSEQPATRAQQAVAQSPLPALRNAAPKQAPLAAKPPAEAAPEITIDIHIGRIDVRAPAAAAPAPAAVSAPAQRNGDALQAYLARRARGARS